MAKKTKKPEVTPTEPPIHTFRTISDLHSIPLEKIEDFCKDLALWLGVCRLTEDLNAKTEGGIKMTSPQDEFTWIDDGKHDVDIKLKIQEKE